MSENLDPASSVILWGTLLLFFGVVGRYLARLCNQSGVLGELLIGVLIGNILYFTGMEVMYILRDSHSVFQIVQKILEGANRQEAISAVIHDKHYAELISKALSSVNANKYIRITLRC